MNLSVLLFTCLSGIVAILLYLLLDFNKRIFEKKSVYETTIADLENAYEFAKEGIPIPRAIELVNRHENNKAVSKMLSKIIATHKLGIEYLTKQALYSKLRQYLETEEKARSEAEGLIQTYSTFSMFIAAVAPAFLMFAFIGSQVLENVHASALLFVSLLLLMLPVLFAVVNTLANRRVYETSE